LCDALLRGVYKAQESLHFASLYIEFLFDFWASYFSGHSLCVDVVMNFEACSLSQFTYGPIKKQMRKHGRD